MKMKSIMIVTLFLAVIMLCTPVFASAASGAETNSSGIKYSDLFYVYDKAYLDSEYFNSYSNDVYNILLEVQEDYIDDYGFAADIKTAIHASVHWLDWCKIVSDKMFGTSFHQNEAYDSANLQFAQQLLSEENIKTMSSELTSLSENAKKVSDILTNIAIDADLHLFSTDDIYFRVWSELSDKNILVYLGTDNINKTKTIKVSKYFDGVVKFGAEALELVSAIAAGALMENFRMELIDNLIKSSPSNTCWMKASSITTDPMKLRPSFTIVALRIIVFITLCLRVWDIV